AVVQTQGLLDASFHRATRQGDPHLKAEHTKPLDQVVVGVIGLGYVGLPLATEFGRTRRTIAFDIDQRRIAELREGRDHTREVSSDALAGAKHMLVTDDPARLGECDVILVTVPT